MQVPFVDLKAQYQALKAEIHQALAAALDSMELYLGPNVRAFESEFAAFCGAEHAVGVASGTDGLYLALRACGVGAGDEVITVSNTFIATAEAIALVGAIPVYVDIDPVTYTLDPALLEAAIGPRTRAIIPVHLYGQMADMDRIMAIARRHKLVVVEDACQAHGAHQSGRTAGTVGDAAAFSFYMSKNLGAYGEAGAVTTNSPVIAERIRILRSHGSAQRYVHQEMGINSRLDELQAAVLRIKLRHLTDWNRHRQQHAASYDRLLAGLPIERPTVAADRSHVFHLYVIQTAERERVAHALNTAGIATGIHYPIPIHQQAASHGFGRVVGSLTVTEAVTPRILSLPMYAELTAAQLTYVAENLHTALALKEAPVASS